MILSNRLKQALPECRYEIYCTKSVRNPSFEANYYKYATTLFVSVYSNCEESHFEELIATCKSKVLESKKEQAKYTTFRLPSIGEVFNRSGALFDGIPVSETEEPLLIAMYSGDYIAWQAYADWLEENGHWQAHYIRHYINLHLKRIGQQ